MAFRFALDVKSGIIDALLALVARAVRDRNAPIPVADEKRVQVSHARREPVQIRKNPAAGSYP